ncbi:uncharacterized protein [Lepeophtheirus salmonis]|uniref:uncharacterized protein n=1 Tax=Lepeophtheirus salmonis TaxID=72036 RepID=UPI001AE658E9|nr:kinetochore protein spc25-like [Lepeophtheirus salmonis]
MDGVPILEFHSFNGEEADESSENLLLKIRPIDSEDESIYMEFEEPDIPNLKEELSNLLNACSESVNEFLFKRNLESPSETWNREALDRIEDLSRSYDEKKLELLETLESEKKLSNQLASLQAKKNALKSQEKSLESKISLMESSISQINQDIDIFNKQYTQYISNEKKSQEIMNEVQKYALVLGLSLQLKEENNHLIIKLRGLYSNNREKECLCELAMLKSSETAYKIVDCIPKIKEQDALERTLNKTQQLCGFVVTLRRKFKEILA